MSDDCSCIYIDGADKPYFSVTKVRKARKKHKCCDCNRTIKPGEKYEYIKGKWDIAIETYKTCVDCVILRSVFFCSESVIPIGGTRDTIEVYIEEMQGNISEDYIIKLSPTARKWVCEKIEDCWERYYDNE